MAAWLLQSRPDRFNLAGALRAAPTSMLWLTEKYKNHICISDEVFLWQAIGAGKRSESGVWAVGQVIEPPRLRVDEGETAEFWAEANDAAEERWRTSIRVTEFKNRVLPRDIVEHSCPACVIFRYRQGTDFKLTREEAEEIRRLWSGL